MLAPGEPAQLCPWQLEKKRHRHKMTPNSEKCLAKGLAEGLAKGLAIGLAKGPAKGLAKGSARPVASPFCCWVSFLLLSGL